MSASVLARFTSNDSGNFTTTFALSLPAMIGAVGLGVDVGSWDAAHKALQRAADAAAISAVIGAQAGQNYTDEAWAIAASYNFTAANGATVTVNRPPLSGPNTTNGAAVEVIISQPQRSYFTTLFGMNGPQESGRSVATAGANACVLALDPTASAAVSGQGSIAVNAINCSIYSDSNATGSVNAGGSASISALQVGAVGTVTGTQDITAANGIINNGGTIYDPYAGVAMPSYSGCDQRNFSSKKTVTITPGVYCGGITLNAGANVTMSPGTYILDQGTFTVNGSATLTGNGVTIVFTSSSGSNYATAKINGGANVNLTAPTSGPLAGIVLYGDRNMPVGTSYTLNGGSNQSFNGATYLPKGAISYAGGTNGNNQCAQVIGDTISFVGNSSLTLNCSGVPTRQIGAVAQVLE